MKAGMNHDPLPHAGLYGNLVPHTVANFLANVHADSYAGTIFNKVGQPWLSLCCCLCLACVSCRPLVHGLRWLPDWVKWSPVEAGSDGLLCVTVHKGQSWRQHRLCMPSNHTAYFWYS